MAKTDQELAQDILNSEGINWRYGGDTIVGALMPFRREVLTPEQSQFIGYDSSGNAIIQNIPAQYGETQFDLSYSPAVQSLQGVGSALRDVLFGDANTQAKAVKQAVSALRNVAGGIADYASNQYKAAMGGGTIYDPSTREVTEFDPALVLGGGSSGGGAALASGFRMSGKTPVASIIQQFRDAPESKLEYQKKALAGDENAIAALMEDKLIDRETALLQAQASVDRALYRQDYRNRQQAETNPNLTIQASQVDDYRGAHEPPDREYGAPLNDLTSMIPSDVYGPSGPRLYGLGDPEVDSEAFSALRSARGNPDAEVVVYRAVPEGVSEINSGDWVTTSRKYADMHGENALGGKYKILEQKAKAGDLYSEGYPYEFGWNPLSMNPEARMQRAQDLGFDTSRVSYRGLSGEYDPNKAGNYQMFTSSPEDAGEYGSYVVPAYLNKGNNLVVEGGRNNFNSIPVSNLPAEVKANLHSSVGDVARTDDIAYAAQLAGYDSVTINNVFDKASNEIPLKPLPASNEPMSQEMIDILDEVNASGMLENTPDVALPPSIPKDYEPATIDIIFDPKNIRSTNAEFDPTKADSADLLSSVGATSALRGIV